ncbi:MAG: biopolymer transporter ExbD [Pyrinomonadaceae bacterium]
MNQPQINVTPLIDVLLVLLIIFMVITPLKPSSFKTRIPSEPDHIHSAPPHPLTLAVTITRDLDLKLNSESELGRVDDTSKLIERLERVFSERLAKGTISQSFADAPDRPIKDKIERTVFIKAPRSIGYGNVARVVDAVKIAGAFPISLQIDDMD